MKNKWYALKVKGNYVRDVEPNYNDGKETRVCCTKNIRDCKLMSDEMRKNWIMSLITTTDIDPDDIKSVKMEVESTIVDESETQDFGIRFANGTYLVRMEHDGVSTTKTEMGESETLDHADLDTKENTERLVKMLRVMQEVDVLADNLAGDITIVPIKREYINIEEI